MCLSERCFYEDEDGNCLCKEFKKPMDGLCEGVLKCAFCDSALSKEEFNEKIEICMDCLDTMKMIIEDKMIIN